MTERKIASVLITLYILYYTCFGKINARSNRRLSVRMIGDELTLISLFLIRIANIKIFFKSYQSCYFLTTSSVEWVLDKIELSCNTTASLQPFRCPKFKSQLRSRHLVTIENMQQVMMNQV